MNGCSVSGLLTSLFTLLFALLFYYAFITKRGRSFLISSVIYFDEKQSPVIYEPIPKLKITPWISNF